MAPPIGFQDPVDLIRIEEIDDVPLALQTVFFIFVALMTPAVRFVRHHFPAKPLHFCPVPDFLNTFFVHIAQRLVLFPGSQATRHHSPELGDKQMHPGFHTKSFAFFYGFEISNLSEIKHRLNLLLFCTTIHKGPLMNLLMTNPVFPLFRIQWESIQPDSNIHRVFQFRKITLP